MNLLELVKNRYSCRAYKSLNVEKEKLDYILECVRFAPSAVNKQPWLFHIVSNDEDKAVCSLLKVQNEHTQGYNPISLSPR